MMHVFFSNEQEQLAIFLTKNLFAKSSLPLLKRYIIVDSSSEKNYLQRSIAENPHYGICTGIVFFTLEEAFRFFYEQHFATKIPNRLELFFALLNTISSLKEEDGEIFLPLLEYIHGDQKKRIGLCQTLADLFFQYGIYGEGIVQQWQEKKSWQEVLWQKIFSEKGWTYPIAVLQQTFVAPSQEKGHIHLFNITRLPISYGKFFEKLSPSYPLFHYVLSPCKHFWSDVASDQEVKRIRKQYRKKKVSESSLAALEGYLQNRNPLLANFGKLGRDYIRFLEEWDLYEEEEYIEEQDQTLLGAIKKDLLEANVDAEKDHLNGDPSLQVHLCGSSYLREVQILYEQLSSLFLSYQTTDPLQPKDILVLAPDSNEYAPYIHLIFGAAASPFPYKITDMALTLQSPMVVGFLHFLQLSWEVDDIFFLLDNKAFQGRHQLALEEVQIIKDWICTSRIYFAGSKEHSWEKGSERLLFSLVCAGSDSGIDMADAGLMNTLLQMLSHLREEFSFFRENPHLSLAEWAEKLFGIKNRYFRAGSDQEGDHLVEHALFSLKKIDRDFAGQSFSFSSILEVMKREIQSAGQFQSFLANAITFSSLKKGAVYPAKVIYVLGMQEEAFPRLDISLSLNAIKQKYPTHQDEDRYLFLLLLLSARQHLLFSYRNLSPEDGKPALPSLFIQELLSYFPDRISQAITHTHPLSSSFIAPRSSLIVPPSPSSLFIAPSSLSSPFIAHRSSFIAPPSSLIVSLQTLTKLARHPIQFYLNRKQGIYLQENEKEKYKEQQFTLSSLDSFRFIQEFLQKPDGSILSFWQQGGKLPVSVFGEMAKVKLQQEMALICKKLEALNVAPGSFSKAILTETCIRPEERSPGHWEFPCLQVPLRNGGSAKIVGEIPLITSEGLLLMQECTLSDTLKQWPLILAYQALGNWPAKVLFCKKKPVCKEILLANPLQDLSDYLSYFFLAEQYPVPLLPGWAKALFYEDAVDLQKAIRQSLSERKQFQDGYLQWICKGKEIDPELIHASWAPILRPLFSSLMTIFSSEKS